MDLHVVERHAGVLKHNFEFELASIRNALTFSETPITEYRTPPLRGENTQAVLAGQLGYDEDKIALAVLRSAPSSCELEASHWCKSAHYFNRSTPQIGENRLRSAIKVFAKVITAEMLHNRNQKGVNHEPFDEPPASPPGRLLRPVGRCHEFHSRRRAGGKYG
ncbi:hypothetical protein [Bradyrhizobium sp. 87]|uniref:hypothetical protein n=1 Tax=Bradyrhizobium sp. 87 TaxID=2782682 RepID=UPI001FFBD9DB|nr:hypothetical protein [Bradyrhizobium sp. 87]MCK1425802.1 hypothetical protein [Bradyrhizobium sp. 87]